VLGWGTARWAGPARVQRAEPFRAPSTPNLMHVAHVQRIIHLGYVKASVRWTRTGPAQRAVPHPAVAAPPFPRHQRKLDPCGAPGYFPGRD